MYKPFNSVHSIFVTSVTGDTGLLKNSLANPDRGRSSLRLLGAFVKPPVTPVTPVVAGSNTAPVEGGLNGREAAPVCFANRVQ